MDENDPRLIWIPYIDETLEEFCRRLATTNMKLTGNSHSVCVCVGGGGDGRG